MTGALSIQVTALARRSIRRTMRQPASIAPAMLFPLLLLAVNTGGLRAVTRLPGFPTSSYLDFFIAFTFMQGALFATLNSGTRPRASDIQTGFLSRLSLTPLRRVSLLGGHLSGAMFMGLVQAIVYLVRRHRLRRARSRQALQAFSSSSYSSVSSPWASHAIGTFFALRTGSGEAVQGLVPALLRRCCFSRRCTCRVNLISTDWFRQVATYNPVSYMIEALRSLIIDGLEHRGTGPRVRLRCGSRDRRAHALVQGAEHDGWGEREEAIEIGRARSRLAQSPQLLHAARR